ncbi:MAG: CDP-alcohol phosphatidyltransferase family protein [Simkaniaceae bacterium]|nr:CDP-alcohol phosphatidyltransferase family protein [Simkaniaceae bacterium]
MISPTNGLTFLRGPLALLFVVENLYVRLSVIAAAMITDAIDGYLARRYKCVSRFGATLDPLMDKFFVFTVLSVFFMEGKLALWQIATLLSRDLFLCFFGIYLFSNGLWKNYSFRSVLWSKITTALQFSLLIVLTFSVTVPNALFAIFVVLGFLVFLELVQKSTQLEKKL